MQKAGHRPIALLGGGTTMVGDPSGKTDMRKMLTKEQIAHNAECFKKQFSKLIDFSDNKAIMANNADWLLNLNYVEFLREVGALFSVNRMLTAECYKQRLEKGLTFLEFNYMLMQGYDFLELNRKYGCVMQLGGDDQWSNILAGVDLGRAMNEIKIRFSSGEIGYFKLVDDTDENIVKTYDFLGDAIRDRSSGVFELIDLADDKKTIINIKDITSIGYSKV
jgi:tyrosyl-tRNA synthetase